MYLYFNGDGVLKEFINDKQTRQANSNINKIFCFYEDINDDISYMAVRFRFDDNTYTNLALTDTTETKNIEYDKMRDLKYFRYFTNYKFFVYNIPDEVLAKGGSVECSLKLLNSEQQQIQALEKFTFFIADNLVTEDELITMSQYTYLLLAIADKKNELIAVEETPTVLDDFKNNQVIFSIEDGIFYLIKEVSGTKELIKIPTDYYTKAEILAFLLLKQDKSDNNLETLSKTIVGAINELNTNIENEIEDREDGDTNTLNSAKDYTDDKIQEIKDNPDVVDIVNTYNRGTDTTKTDIVHYDTSSLGDNDIIRVLSDNNPTYPQYLGYSTYYKWDKTHGIWNLVGGITEYYSKSQIDGFLAQKQSRTDNNLQTVNKGIVEAINEVNSYKPILNQNLSAAGFTPVANTYYKHTGTTTTTFINGVIYFYNGTEYKAIDGRGEELNIENGNGTDNIVMKYSGEVDPLHFGNTNTGESATVLGEANVNTANRALVLGKLNRNKSPNALIFGLGNGRGVETVHLDYITGENVIIGGLINTNYIGNNVIITGEQNINQGTTNNSADDVILVGVGLRNYSKFKARFGKWNIDNVNAILQVGNGTSNNARSNAFEVLTDGRAKAYGAPTENNDVTTKQYVDNAISLIPTASSNTNGLLASTDYATQFYINVDDTLLGG